jgi:AcrR family transcriptional regulator
VAEREPTKRRYHSPRREQQAAQTRREILEAAEFLFARDGYPATTMEAIAERAGVSLKTVYLPFSTKSGLLRALWDLRLKGDERDDPVVAHEWFREVMDEPDPATKLNLNARNSAAAKSRIGKLFKVIRGAAEIDDDCAALWRLIQSDFLGNQRMIVEAIDRGGGLRAGLTVDAATDMLWTLNHPDVWNLLVLERGWTPDAYRDWLAATTRAQLLAPPKPTRPAKKAVVRGKPS